MNSTHLQQWSQINNEIQQYNHKLQQLRIQRERLEKIIIEENNAEIGRKLSNNISIVKHNSYEPLTFKFLDDKLRKIITNSTQADTVLNFLKTNRSIKSVIALKMLPK